MLTLFAQRRFDGANKWLDEHPLVLGSGALVLGLILAGSGVYSLYTGRAETKHGVEEEGANAYALAIVRIVAGLGFMGFGIYKSVAAVL